METKTSISKRKSVRFFKSKEVPKSVIEEILIQALRAPSWANSQPWEFAIVGGETIKKIRKNYADNFLAKVKYNPEIGEPKWPEPFLSRIKESSNNLRIAYGIDPEDKEQQKMWSLRGYKFFDAPNAIIVHMNKELGFWSMLDLGSIITTIQLLAIDYGIGCCVQMQMVRWPEILRKYLKISKENRIIIGISLGYPDKLELIEKYRSKREPLEKISEWHGF